MAGIVGRGAVFAPRVGHRVGSAVNLVHGLGLPPPMHQAERTEQPGGLRIGDLGDSVRADAYAAAERSPAMTPTPTPAQQPVFLRARWCDLLLAQYAVDERVLAPLVPRGLELDPWHGKHVVSLVAFRFLRTRLKGIAIPFHTDFDEINLRFYVRRFVDGAERRGVVFIKEIVPRLAIATVARLVYDEPYVALPTRHRVEPDRVDYAWKHRGRWDRVAGSRAGEPTLVVDGTEAAFITEHYFGSTRRRDGSTHEYQVEHPRWRTWNASDVTIDVDASALYGAEFGAALAAAPQSVFIAEGSDVVVRGGVRIA